MPMDCKLVNGLSLNHFLCKFNHLDATSTTLHCVEGALNTSSGTIQDHKGTPFEKIERDFLTDQKPRFLDLTFYATRMTIECQWNDSGLSQNLNNQILPYRQAGVSSFRLCIGIGLDKRKLDTPAWLYGKWH